MRTFVNDSISEGRPIQSRKLTHLECARGVASFIVLFHHFTLAFAPDLRADFTAGGLKLTPLYPILNGQAAVVFFFLLSGYVLTRKFYQNPSAVGLAEAVAKRLPRLMLPASVTIIAGYLILAYGPQDYKLAADISGSDWLRTFAGAHIPSDFTPSLSSAISECVTVFLLPEHFHYNSNLWTMKFEYFGSLLVFLISAIFFFRYFRQLRWMVPLHFAGFILSRMWEPNYTPFLIGSGLAYLLEGQKYSLKLSNWAAWAMFILGIILLSGQRDELDIAGAVLIMLVLLGNVGVAQWLSGPVSSFVGTLSFPLYLVHTLVILSVSSVFFLHASGFGSTRPAILLMTFTLTVLVALVACIPLVYLESWWVPWLNRFIKNVGATRVAQRVQLIEVASDEIKTHGNSEYISRP